MLATADVREFFVTARPVVYAVLPPLTLFALASVMPTWGIFWGVPVAIVASLATIYFLRPVQSQIETMPYGPAQVCVFFPFILIALLWIAFLLNTGRMHAFNLVLPGFLLSMVTGLWPIFRKTREQHERPRTTDYLVSGGIATAVYVGIVIAGVLTS